MVTLIMPIFIFRKLFYCKVMLAFLSAGFSTEITTNEKIIPIIEVDIEASVQCKRK